MVLFIKKFLNHIRIPYLWKTDMYTFGEGFDVIVFISLRHCYMIIRTDTKYL